MVLSEQVPGASAALKHDFAITENHLVFLEMSVTFDHTETSGIPYAWSDDIAPRLGVLPRGAGGAARARWYDIEPGQALHFANAYEDAKGRIVIEGPTVDRVGWELSWNWWAGTGGPHHGEPVTRSLTRRWVVDPVTGTVTEGLCDDLNVEFPTINEDLLGREHRYQYAIAFPDDRNRNHGVVKYDRRDGSRQILDVGAGVLPSEAVFVPAADATREDDGYLLTVTSDLNRDASSLLVLDAGDLHRAPIATIRLPRRVTAGIHGSWIPDEQTS